MIYTILDNEVRGRIFSYLDTTDLLRCRETSSKHPTLFVSTGHALTHIRRVSCNVLKTANVLGALGRVYDSTLTDLHISNKNNIHETCMSIAHKGVSSKFAGNTIPAFMEAVRIGAEMIELDIIMCKTGNIVVHHDPYLPNGELVRRTEMADIRKEFPEIPTLQEVLKALENSNIRIYFDLKCPNIIDPLLSILHHAVEGEGWNPHRLLIASFDQYDLLEVNAFKLSHGIDFETIVIVDSMPLGYAACFAELNVNYISIAQGRIIPEFVEDAHRRGMGVLAWTVNNKNLWREFISMGVDGIVTDFPEELQEFRSPVNSEGQTERHQGDKFSMDKLYPEQFHGLRSQIAKGLREASPILFFCQKYELNVVQKADVEKLQSAIEKSNTLCTRHLKPFLLCNDSFEKIVAAILHISSDENAISLPSDDLLGFEKQWIRNICQQGIPINIT